VTDQLPFSAEARSYLVTCAAYPYVDRRYHPTEDGAVKIIWHRDASQAAQIRNTFRMLTEGQNRK
jgi:hypothetical protein